MKPSYPTDLCRVDAVGVVALELAQCAVEGRAVRRLVGQVAAVVLPVALPPERDALQGGGALKQSYKITRSQLILKGRHTLYCSLLGNVLLNSFPCRSIHPR